MTASLKSIVRERARSYQVAIEEVNGTNRAFTFDVVEGDIQCVVWKDDFTEYMGGNLGPASNLFEAVLTFLSGADHSDSGPLIDGNASP